jgi:hypothetical protein
MTPHQRRSILFGALFLGGLLVIAWLNYYPTSPMLAALGIPGPRANTRRQCHRTNEPTMIGLMPTRMMYCNGRSPSFYGESDQQYVNMDVVNRKLLHAGNMWISPDSSHWEKGRDSVAASLQRLGGRRFACVKGEGWLPQAAERRYWKFPTFYVRLVAYSWDTRRRGIRLATQLEGSLEPPPECTGTWRDVAPVDDTCDADVLFQMPLPGNRVLCVRTKLWN